MSVSTFHNIRSSYQDASLGFHLLGEIPTCGDSNTQNFQRISLVLFRLPTLKFSSSCWTWFTMDFLYQLWHHLLVRWTIYLFIYLFINFAKRPRSLTEQAPRSKLLSACECDNFYTILYLTSLNGKAAANQFGTSLYNFLSFVSVLHHLLPQFAPWGGGVLPRSRLMGRCRWMGSHFHDWINYYGVWGCIFIRVTWMGSHIFRILGVRKFGSVGI